MALDFHRRDHGADRNGLLPVDHGFGLLSHGRDPDLQGDGLLRLHLRSPLHHGRRSDERHGSYRPAGSMGQIGCGQTSGRTWPSPSWSPRPSLAESAAAPWETSRPWGRSLFPILKKEGYGKDFACALTAASAVVDPIIPPSIIIVIYAAVMNTSIGAMYAAAIIPGFLLIFGDMVIVHYLAKKRNYPRRQEPISMKELATGTRDAVLALIMPLIILGGIFLGVFTPTEAAAVAVGYALFVGIVIYRHMNLKEIPRILFNAAYNSGTLFFVIACASILGWAFAMMQVPQQVLTLFSGLKAYPWLILLIMNSFSCGWGCGWM